MLDPNFAGAHQAYAEILQRMGRPDEAIAESRRAAELDPLWRRVPLGGQDFCLGFVPEHLRASGVGWYSATVGLLGLIASVVAGLLWDRVGHSAVFYYGAIFAGVGSLGLLTMIPGKRDKFAGS